MTLFNLFENIFTRTSEEKEMNPQLEGKDFHLVVDVMLEIAKSKGIDIWADQSIKPKWSVSDEGKRFNRNPGAILRDIKDYNHLFQQYDGNPVKENICVYKPEKNLLSHSFDDYSPSISDYSYVRWCNKVFNTDYSFEQHFDNSKKEVEEEFWNTHAATGEYFCLTLYFIQMIDRWAHMFCSENDEVLVYRDDIAEYKWDKTLWYRVLEYNPNTRSTRRQPDTSHPMVIISYYGEICEGTIYFRGDFTEETIPEELQVCWKFFQENESILEKFY